MRPRNGKKKFRLAGVSLLVTLVLIVGVATQAVELDRVTIDENWKTVRLKDTYRNPVVVAKPLSYNGGDPATVRIKNVGHRSFQIRVQEWGYLDDTHAEETVTYMVMDKGSYRLSTGMRAEANILETDATGSTKRIRFSTPFRKTPVVFSSVMTYEGKAAVITRNQNVSRSGFEIMMQEEESHKPKHATERIGYIAIEPGSGSINGRRMEVGTTNPIAENFKKINFGFGESITVKADEETSVDSEKNHADETIGYLALQGGPRNFLADMQTTEGSDPANLRYGGKTVPEEEKQPPSRPVPQGIIIEPPSQPELNVEVSTDRPQYPIGSNLRIFLNLSKRAYVYVFDYDTQGRMRLVFPNRYSRQNLIRPGRYQLPDGPYSYEVTGPPGIEFVQAVATTKKIDISKFLKRQDSPFSQQRYPLVADPKNLNREFKSRLKASFKFQIGGEEPGIKVDVSPVSWDSDTTRFRVGAAPQPNEQPVAQFRFDPSNPRTGERVEFSAYASYDPDGSIVNYRWDFDGDGRTDTTGPRVTNRFYSSGPQQVTLSVEDNNGARSSTTKTVQVGRKNQAPTARFNYSPSRPEPGERVDFDASGSYDPDGNITSYRWDLNDDGFADTFGSRARHSFNSSGSKQVTLTVVDDNGARSSSTQTVKVVRPRPRFSSTEPDSFQSNGNRVGNWYWLRSYNHHGEWEWSRISTRPKNAYINFEFLVSNRQNGGSGYDATVEVQILNRYGNVVESGKVNLKNPFRPRFSGDTNGVGYEAFGVYDIRNPSQLRNGFKVRVEWPPTDNRNHFAVKRSAAILAYTS